MNKILTQTRMIFIGNHIKTVFFTKTVGLSLCALMLAGCSSLKPVPQEPEAVKVQPTRAPIVGLALGGGAARGFAHVGVIQVLEAHGVAVDLLAGTSAGSVVAVQYASGMRAKELEAAAMSMDEATLSDWTLPLFGRGLLRGEALARYVDQQVKGQTLEQFRIPVGVLATQLSTGQGVLFRRGDTGTAVRASSAVPGVFSPVSVGSEVYVDGGLVAPVPVEGVLSMGAELVIAVDISSTPQDGTGTDVLRTLLRTFSIMGQSINRLALKEADVVVRPRLEGMGSADFASRQKAIEAGRQAMQLAMPRLQQLLQDKRVPTP
jgi:NTE family protein